MRVILPMWVSLRIQWRLIFAIVRRCYRLLLRAGYFFYFRIRLVFFWWMFFDSVKEIDRLRKEVHRLLSKTLYIYLKVTIETFSKLRFSEFKNFIARTVFGELQLTQISLNFKTSCCNLEISGLGAKLCVSFLLF